MTTTRLVCCATLSCLIGLMVLGLVSSSAEPAERKPKTRQLSLAETWTTSEQKCLRRLTSENAPDGISKISAKVKTSDVFFVSGKTIVEAWKGLSAILAEARSPEDLVDRKKGADLSNIWLVTYLGVASSGPSFFVDSIEVVDNVFIFTYRFGASGNFDGMSYVYLTPMGELEPGRYEIRLVDASTSLTTFARWIDVK